MTNEEILEKQVEALEKLLQLKQAIIDEYEAKINKLEMERLQSNPPYPVNIPYIGGGSINFDPCPVGPDTHHDYPGIWHGTTPPSCSKCGKQQGLSWTVTNSDSIDVDLNNSSNADGTTSDNKLTIFTAVAKR